MNNLSWLLYWADVLPSVSNVFATIMFLLMLISAFCTLLYVSAGFGDWTNKPEYVARFRYFPAATVLAFLLFAASWLVPSKETFYLIAASEAGETALESPEFKKVRTIINDYLDDALKTNSEETK